MNTTIRAGWIMLTLLCATLSLSAQTVQEELARADKQFDLYAYNLAIRTYESVLKSEPNNARALARIADCYFQLNRPEEALPFYDRAVAQAGVDPQVMLRYGKALMQTNDYIGAKKWFLFYAEKDPAAGRHYADMCDFAIKSGDKGVQYQVKNEPLNTASADYGAAFFGNRVVYNSSRSDIQRKTAPKTSQDWTGSAYNQIYITQRNAADNFLQRPEFLQGDLENEFNEGPVSFSADGRRVAFCKNNFIDGTRQVAERGINMSLYIADVVDGKWVNKRPFDYNGSSYATGFPSLSADGNTLYFASNQPSGMGGWDIYVSNWTAAGWSAPANLGAPLNTPGNEVTPFFDGQNLFFASDWHNGFGGLDIFRANLEDDQVTDILHLGPGVNSPRDDYGFVYNTTASIGYFTSNRPQGRGNEDLWQAVKAIDEFEILVQDMTMRPIPGADIDFSSCGAGVMQTDQSGRYAFVVASGKANCQVTVRKAGYMDQIAPVRSSGEKNISVILAPNTMAPAEPAFMVESAPESAGFEPPPPVTGAPGSPEFYTLRVTDMSGKPLSGAEVDMSSCGGGKVYTDVLGETRVFMDPSTSCVLSINKLGFEPTILTARPNTTKTLTVPLDPVQSQVVSYGSPPATRPAPVVHNIDMRRTGAETLAGKTPSPTPPVVYNIESKPVLTSGYAVQLASNPGGENEADIRAFDGLTPYGNLYARTDNNRTRIRLGVFATKAEAEAVLIKARTMVSDAYIVQEKDIDGSLLVGAAPVTPKAPSSEPAAFRSVEAPPVPTVSDRVYFAVQVAAISGQSPIGFGPYEGLTRYGNVYIKPESGDMKVRVGVWMSYPEADAARNQILSSGFRDAIIISEKAGDPTIDRFQLSVTTPAVNQPQTKNLVPKGGGDSAFEYPSFGNSAFGELVAPKNAPKVYTTQPPPPTMVPLSNMPKARTGASKDGSDYKVRICSMINPSVFNVERAESVGGKIEPRINEETMTTIMLLGGFDSLEDTIQATNRLKVLGFKDAFVVREEGEKLIRVRHDQ